MLFILPIPLGQPLAQMTPPPPPQPPPVASPATSRVLPTGSRTEKRVSVFLSKHIYSTILLVNATVILMVHVGIFFVVQLLGKTLL